MAAELTYRVKEATTCPVCGKKFNLEKLNSGGGRLITKDLLPDLRRTYTPSEKFGEVFPEIYPVLVCPLCYYAAYPAEFDKLKSREADVLKETEGDRKLFIKELFDDLDFVAPRRLQEGIASYLLAIYCYDYLNEDKSPSIRQGMSALRAGWLCQEMHKKFPNDNYDYLAELLFRKAGFFYRQAVDMEIACKQRVSDTPGIGPDTDKNYGFDGVLYLYAYLEFKYGPDNDAKVRLEQVKRAKNFCGRIFGMGRSNKEKPVALLNFARDLYEEMGKWIREHDENASDA